MEKFDELLATNLSKFSQFLENGIILQPYKNGALVNFSSLNSYILKSNSSEFSTTNNLHYYKMNY